MIPRSWRHIHDWLILCGFLAVSVGVMLTTNEGLVRGARAASLEITAWVEARFFWAGDYLWALTENESLRSRNVFLASHIARSREALIENERLRNLLGFRDTMATYDLLPARIVNKDPTGQWNYFTLNVGAADGVESRMAVIDEKGVLGHVLLVSEHYARVMPYAHTGIRIPAKVQPLQAFGIVRWDGARADRLRLDHLVKTQPAAAGQTVVTAGYSGVFPPGLPIGTIDSVAVQTGRNELVIFVRPATSLSTAEHAFVIRKRPDPERLALERQSIGELP